MNEFDKFASITNNNKDLKWKMNNMKYNQKNNEFLLRSVIPLPPTILLIRISHKLSTFYKNLTGTVIAHMLGVYWSILCTHTFNHILTIIQ